MRPLRHLAAILVLPSTMAILVPYLLVSARPLPVGWMDAGPAGLGRLVLGIAVTAAGLGLVCATIRQFATRGNGTLAPWDPPTRMVVSGLYRHVRNPMITGVILLIAGESLLLRSPGVARWAAVFFLINAAYIPLLEEPGLERRFGEPYRAYRRHVPRWIPRARPWTPPDASP